MRLLPALLLALLLSACSTASAPSAAQPPAPSAAPPQSFSSAQVERAVHEAVNEARRQRERVPFAWRDSLALLARGHSRDMAQHDFFSHTSPDGTGPNHRAQALGLPTMRPVDEQQSIGLGENLFATGRSAGHRDVYRKQGGARQHVKRIYKWKTLDALAEEAVRSWLESPPHRRALLSPDYERHGIGVALTDERVYVTQNLF